MEMRYQEYVCKASQAAADEAFRYAKAVPADKADWAPLDAGRSVLDQAREMAKCPNWAYLLVSGGDMPEFSEENMAKMKAEMDLLKTVDECQAECNQNLAKLFELYKSIPDEKLADTKWLPFSGGRDFTWEEMMDYPRWNFTYHLGQIGYVQTLYGDKEMY